ncbi:hypothetical protein ACOZ35_07170 [Halorubrum xinjiangense]|uniref:hypothetical protein n=1 Tax=Halorubrum xinjiangense TaxID=261291 RepID=UPI003C6F1BCE
MGSRLESLLLGKSLKLSLRYLGYSVVLMALSFGQRYLAGNSEMGNTFGLFTSPLGVAVVAIVLAGIHTYRNDGILVSTAVAVITVSGYSLYAVTALNHPQPDYGLLTGAGTAIFYGLPMGILASTVAYAFRRFAPN